MNNRMKKRVKNYRFWLVVIFVMPVFLPPILIIKAIKLLGKAIEMFAEFLEGILDFIGELLRLSKFLKWVERNEK